MERASARSIGPWTVHEQIGKGGNAKVYRAERDGELSIALKVLDRQRVGGERYRRFVQEIKFLRSLGPFPGVLPLLDAHLPAIPTNADPPWLSMPIATPIADAVGGLPLDQVVAAVAQIASTLAQLAERGAGHRDIKPGNLYELDGEWLVGDFGLVAAPEADDDITRAGKALGPAHFTAYEMIIDPVGADPLPADVYSLAKTLWSLVTGLPYPPEGHQPADSRAWSIRELRPDGRSSALDQLIDRATQLTPGARPTMAQFATELRTWQQLSTTSPAIDVAGHAARLRERMRGEIDGEDVQAERKRLALATVRTLQQACRSLDDALKAIHPRPELDIVGDKLTNTMLHLTHRTRDAAFSYERTSKIASRLDLRRYVVAYGRGLDLLEDGEVVLGAYVIVHFEKVMGSDFHWSSGDRSAPAGSIEAERTVQQLVSARGRTRQSHRRVRGEGADDGLGDSRRRTAHEAEHVAAPVLEDLQRLGGVAVKFDTAHVVRFGKRRIDRRLVALDPGTELEESASLPTHSLEFASELT